MRAQLAGLDQPSRQRDAIIRAASRRDDNQPLWSEEERKKG